jgi:aspartate 1-decarboxylase
MKMSVTVLQSKIHRATVTQADLHYEGSLTIDEHLMQLAGIKPYQGIAVYDITNGNRFETYAIKGEAHSGVIQVNGAAAHLTQPGDLIIICAYGQVKYDRLELDYEPTVILVDEKNVPTLIKTQEPKELVHN